MLKLISHYFLLCEVPQTSPPQQQGSHLTFRNTCDPETTPKPQSLRSTQHALNRHSQTCTPWKTHLFPRVQPEEALSCITQRYSSHSGSPQPELSWTPSSPRNYKLDWKMGVENGPLVPLQSRQHEGRWTFHTVGWNPYERKAQPWATWWGREAPGFRDIDASSMSNWACNRLQGRFPNSDLLTSSDCEVSFCPPEPCILISLPATGEVSIAQSLEHPSSGGLHLSLPRLRPAQTLWVCVCLPERGHEQWAPT